MLDKVNLIHLDKVAQSSLDAIDWLAAVAPHNHLVDEQNSTFMQTLATNIAEILTENNIVSNIKLIRDDPDFELQYRNVGFPNTNVASMKTKLKTIVLDIANDLEK